MRRNLLSTHMPMILSLYPKLINQIHKISLSKYPGRKFLYRFSIKKKKFEQKNYQFYFRVPGILSSNLTSSFFFFSFSCVIENVENTGEISGGCFPRKKILNRSRSSKISDLRDEKLGILSSYDILRIPQRQIIFPDSKPK